MKISSILQYSTLDFRFLDVNLQQLSKISDEIIIPICDHFFNGEPENKELLEKSFDIIKKYPKTKGYLFNWEGPNSNPGYYHNVSRALGTSIAVNDQLFFVDGDEIVDDNFTEWLKTDFNPDVTYWMTCYWYFREPIYQSKSYEGCGLLINKNKCNWNVNVRDERQQLFSLPNFIHGGYSHILYNEKPVMHHFSWVRTKEEMIKKVSNWGHKNDTNWIELVEEEFKYPFKGVDFVHQYSYNIVDNKFKL
jgi:acetone carboxylase gamma subunit